ncbi:MAG: hypothetical protein BGP24_16565 [Lysobacterales bacterium 69-70]|nr:hypothetical protein [Xanthomonadaceae bacterium]ODU33618.1 MAG: hypothetical protein ABS97_11560 [Xanthomonadaceae bacterium SCN 69-320]ODV21937.1 MAG: hypothetical protein ABT27_03310 [Xanthomonadaceae bacterium SCN 69-25]OJZ02840.1 MAG: hypothetical protein BGP24_16565 [Xanthomonadales bacterium 69-70]
MRLDLRTAALTEQEEQRVRIAAQLLAAHGGQARVGAWDGTRCDLVVLNADDGYGRHVLDIARRRGVPAVALGPLRPDTEPAGGIVAAEGSAASLAAALWRLVGTAAGEAATRPAPGVRNTAADQAGLLRLAATPLRGADVRATIAGRSIILRPSIGRTRGRTLSDLLAARDHLGEGGWQFEALAPGVDDAMPTDSAMSLDAFLLTGALRARAALPPFPDGEWALRDWPDLGAAADVVAGLRLAQRLRRAAATPQGLADGTGIARDVADACLWAFRAANLLTEIAAPVPRAPAAPPVVRQLLNRLAARFGLAR